MAHHSTHNTIPTREPAVLRFVKSRPIVAWFLLTAFVGAMVAWIVRAW